ncbi:MAG: IS1634 family transposase [Geobacteraceae bacterium]|jgi:transposase|nr:MAG: IS1634 family transposase [Geobacteraceae bacterium]RPJ11383.1 MAG: IS1634 family transposase [Deltaproteobacteria bacterium]RPJ13251.1 MAG: IS1634 family transposase [Deltaproteobacteria bacterium]
MFARIKKSGKYHYLQIVENNKVKGQVKQRVIATIGRLDQLQEKGRVETLIRSLSRYSEKAMLILTGHSDPEALTIKIGPALIFERLWEQSGIKKALRRLLNGRKFEFDVERAVFLTVLHRLMTSGSDRYCERWRRDYAVAGTEPLELHHLYRAMAFLGAPLTDQSAASALAPRCNKDLIEEDIFKTWRDLFSGLELVFFDTTSIYFEGEGGEALGERGFSKDHRPDLKQMVVGVVINDEGRPICCEMWPGNTTDVKTLVTITQGLRQRFQIQRFCIVADRGMISAENLKYLEAQNTIAYILGTRMRKDKEVREQVLTCGGRYQEVHPLGSKTKDPSPLKVKEVRHMGHRYIVCLNERQATKDKLTREAIIKALEEKIPKGPKGLVGNKGYRRYVKIEKDSTSIDFEKVKAEARFDGKWILRTNTDLATAQVALKYKELWQVERVFRDVKSMLETRPVFHQRDDTIRGHVFCSFLALVLRKELERHLEKAGHIFEWSHIKQDLRALQETHIEENGTQLAIRSKAEGVCGKVFQAVGMAMPPTIREI